MHIFRACCGNPVKVVNPNIVPVPVVRPTPVAIHTPVPRRQIKDSVLYDSEEDSIDENNENENKQPEKKEDCTVM